jgi:hypothetical protein
MVFNSSKISFLKIFLNQAAGVLLEPHPMVLRVLFRNASLGSKLKIS